MFAYERYISDGTFAYPRIPGTTMAVVHNGHREEWSFLHDTMMCVYNGSIYMAWYTCPRGEIADETLIMGRKSEDNGASWSEPFVIVRDDGSHGAPRHYVPVSFLVHQGMLYAIVSEMTAHDRPVQTKLYRMIREQDEERWEYAATLISEADNLSLIVNNNAVALPDGRLLLSGRFFPEKNRYPDRPCVLLSDGDITKWKLVPLTSETLGNCPETSVTVTPGGKLIGVTRNTFGENSKFFVSGDWGKTWTSVENPIPVVGSKLYTATLESGRTLVAFNSAGEEQKRTRLCLGILNPETLEFTDIRTVAYGPSEVGDWYHYPCIVEKDGFVFVSCSAHSDHIRSAVIFRFEEKELRSEN